MKFPKMKPLRMRFDAENWYQPHLNLLTGALLPFSWLFGLVAAVRRWCYRRRIFKSHCFDIPVIVVGNLTVGGTGKTPFVIALAQYLASCGYHPGIVSRGVGGSRGNAPMVVHSNSSVVDAGDEAVLLARKSHGPVVICVDRVAAVTALLQNFPDCDVVISDDGLQHYRLARSIEIAVIDGIRNFGNGHLLPAGPMREPRSRLSAVDFVVVNGGVMDHAYQMKIEPLGLVSLQDKNLRYEASALNTKKAHAIAGIGHPAKFFNLLREQGYQVIEHAFPDHHPYSASDLDFGDRLPILMTEKDAVKCVKFADERMLYLDVSAKLDDKFLGKIRAKLQG